jgi:hypothetical protein
MMECPCFSLVKEGADALYLIEIEMSNQQTQQNPQRKDNEPSSIMNFLTNAILSPIAELYSLLPDSILFGSLLLYTITQNLSYGIFSLFILETILSHRLLSWIMIQTFGQSRSENPNMQCRAGFKTPQVNAVRMLSHNQYPSYAIYSLTSIGTYLGLSTYQFSNTFEAMGSEWSGRSMTAYIFIGAVLLAFILVRMYSCKEGFSEIAIAFIFAIVLGFAFFKLNVLLFGEEAINFLGLPYLSEKAANGAPIYVCSADPSSGNK